MKIRLDFVTNSSSSSFIIAKHVNFKMEDLEKLISNEIEKFTEFYMSEIIEEGYHDEEIFKNCKTKKQKKDKIREEIIKGFDRIEADMKLDNWSISTFEASSESDDILSLFLYEHYLGIDTDTIKITEGSN